MGARKGRFSVETAYCVKSQPVHQYDNNNPSFKISPPSETEGTLTTILG